MSQRERDRVGRNRGCVILQPLPRTGRRPSRAGPAVALHWFGSGGRAPMAGFRSPLPAAARWVLPGLAAIAVLLTLTVQAGVDSVFHPPHWPAARLSARSDPHRG